MVRRIFKYTIIVILIVIVLFWFLGGGIGKIVSAARSFHFLTFSDLLTSTSTLSNFQLPWQPAMPTVDVIPVGELGDYGELGESAPHASFANASAYANQVAIIEGAARTQTASGQYVELRAEPSLTAPIRISGWSLESALSGVRAYIPQATNTFLQSRINPVVDVVLPPSGSAVVLTGISPVGVSFRENKCTGYLGTLQPFVPPLRQACPAPLSEIPRTSENVTKYGASCFDYLASLAPCTFPVSPPPSLTAACLSTIQNRLSYSGCVSAYGGSTSFAQNSWRLFLAQGEPVWDGEHDVIRLLDSEGRVVSILSY